MFVGDQGCIVNRLYLSEPEATMLSLRVCLRQRLHCSFSRFMSEVELLSLGVLAIEVALLNLRECWFPRLHCTAFVFV